MPSSLSGTINEQIQLVEESSDQASCSQYETSTEKDDSVFKMEDLESISPFPEHCSQEDLHGKGSSFSSCSDFNESFIESRYDDQDKNLSGEYLSNGHISKNGIQLTWCISSRSNKGRIG